MLTAERTQVSAVAHVLSSDATTARTAVEDLHRVKPAIYWADLLCSAALGWTAFAWAAVHAGQWDICLPAAALAVFALYRGLSFVHEISHLPREALPGFEAAWNLCFGFPLLMPSFTYVGVHQFHHAQATYGTAQDPEYRPFAQSQLMSVVFFAHSVLIPCALLIRFFLLGPLGLCVPRLHRWIVAHASSLSMNAAYVRAVTPALEAKVRRGECAILGLGVFFACAAALGWAGWAPAAIWYGVAASIACINTLRTLGAHRYESDGDPRDREEQLADSIDTPGAWWTELWAPVGLRYHALHHYFPGIPYYHLPEAHRRLVKLLPEHATYRHVQSPSLLHSLRSLLTRGAR